MDIKLSNIIINNEQRLNTNDEKLEIARIRQVTVKDKILFAFEENMIC